MELAKKVIDVVSSRNKDLQDQSSSPLDSYQITPLVQMFQDYAGELDEPNRKLLNQYFLVKCLTGARSEQFFSIHSDQI
jgi:hypothetical protein